MGGMEMIANIKQFIRNCKRVIKYLPLIWEHRNYDYGYIFKINKQLHEDLYEGIYTKGHHVFSNSESRKLRIVINLLDRLDKDRYDEQTQDITDAKYGPNEYYFKKIEGTNYSTYGNTREDNMTEKQKEDYFKFRKRLWALEKYRRDEDLKLLGKYIEKYSNKWWD